MRASTERSARFLQGGRPQAADPNAGSPPGQERHETLGIRILLHGHTTNSAFVCSLETANAEVPRPFRIVADPGAAVTDDMPPHENPERRSL